MARTADGRKKKRQRLSGSDSSAKDAKMHEDSPASMKQDRSLRPRSKESPPEVAKRARTDATNTPSSLQQQETTEKIEEKGAKVLPIMSGRRSGPHESSGPRKEAKGSPDVEDLRNFVETFGGMLEDGWQVDAHRSHTGKLTKTFISPSNEKFRSRIEVAKHLGLEANLLKKGEITKANNEVIPMDHDEEAHLHKETGDLLRDKKGSKSSLRSRSYAKDSGQRKENGSKSPNFHEKAAANTSNGLILALDASKAIVDAQKAPEAARVTQRCQDALRNIISTDSFAALSNMLNRGSSSGSLESPLQHKVLPLIAGPLDLQLIHVRLSNGVYGQTPELFSADIQQVWKNITAAGNELVALARALSEFSDKLYKQQILSLFHGASKEISERKGLPLSTSQHGKQSIEDSGVSLNNSHILPESQSMTPPASTIAVRTRLLEKGTPGQEQTPSTNQAAQGSPQSLSKKAGVVPRSYKNKRRPKKVTKSKRLRVLKMKAADNTTPGVCKSCGLKQGRDCVVCRLCNAVFHTHCMDFPSDSLPDSEWCCPSCATKENATEEVNKSKDRDVLKTSGRTGVCVACKKEDDSLLLCDACEAAYHMNCLNPPIDSVPDESWYCPTCAEGQQKSTVSLEDAHENNAHPDGHNCSVCDRISKDPPPPNENTPTEHAAPENTSSLEGARSPDQSGEHGTPKHVTELESPEASVENGSPEPSFLLENENACKVCGVESTKSAVSCAWCSKRFHLSCLRPALKRLPRKTWFCPSCLCRVCKFDADDEKILLCDICDEGYHTYCLDPPLSEKPEGAWFCPSCAKDAAPNSPRQTEVLKRKRKSTEPRRST